MRTEQQIQQPGLQNGAGGRLDFCPLTDSSQVIQWRHLDMT